MYFFLLLLFGVLIECYNHEDTNIEIYDYINDLKRLQITADETKVYNPSNQDLWFSRNGETIMIKAGETLEC